MSTPPYNSTIDDLSNNSINEAKPKFCSVNIAQRPSINDFGLRKEGSMLRSKDIMMMSKRDSSGIQNSMKGKQSIARWIVRKGKKVPIFGLGRGSVEMPHNVTLVASRIDDSLKKRSVEVQFDGVNAEAICKTKNFLEYKICLYSSDDGASTHIEIIRIDGYGLEFNSERQAIINAANGLGAVVSKKQIRKPLPIPADLMKLYRPPSRSELESTIHRACDNFHSKNRHVVLFALQNLAAVTNASKANTGTAHEMSNLITSNECNVLDLILAIYCAKSEFSSDNVGDQICHSCLSIFYNGLQYIVSSNRKSFLDDTYEQFVEKLIPRLIEDVRECGQNRTSNACLALQCLQLILTNSSIAWQRSEAFKIREVVMQAQEYGHREYLNLETIAKSTIDTLTVN